MTKNERLNKLFVEYELTYDKNNPDSRDNDVFIHKHYKIITKPGLDKIEQKAKIKIEIDPLNGTCGPDWCVLRGTGTRQGVENEIKKYTTTASANAATCKTGYYAEIAEKRLRSRIVLMLAGFYELGVYGKDEIEKGEEPTQVEKTTLFQQ